MPHAEGKRPVTIVSAVMRPDGFADFAVTQVEVTQVEYENAIHLYLAEADLLEAGFEEPFVHFPEDEAPPFLLPAVHNPTGRVLDRGRRQALARTLDKLDMTVVEDNTLADLTYEEARDAGHFDGEGLIPDPDPAPEAAPFAHERLVGHLDGRRSRARIAIERQQAPLLRAALLEGARLAAGGERLASAIIAAARKIIDTSPLARIDYLELVNADTLQPIEIVQPNSLIALAVFFGQTRLIDNIRLP